MIYVYVASTYALYLALFLKENDDNIHILYSRKNYKEVFENLNIHATFIKDPTIWDYIFKPKIIRKKIECVNKIISKNDMHFCHLQFSTFLFVILNNRLNGARSYFYNFEPIARNRIRLFDILRNFKGFNYYRLLQLSLSLQFNTKTTFSFYAQTFYLSLDKNTFKKANIITQKINYTYEELQKKVLLRYQLTTKKMKNIFIGQNESEVIGKFYSTTSINKLYEFIRYYNIPVKPHPCRYTYPNVKTIISPDIPSEFFFESITNSIISISSTTLISASNYFRERNDIKIICLMNLIHCLDKKSEQEMMERIKKRSKDNIIYPESFEELEKLIK